MTTWVCCACGTQHAPSAEPPAACAICEDPRQYVPHDRGQRWAPWPEVVRDHRAAIRDDHGLLGIGMTPSFAIGQRALLVRSAVGNVLWECITQLDDEIVERVAAAGGLAAIAISHPHYYAAMVEWAHAFACPILLHRDDAVHVQRPDPAIHFWEGETNHLGGGLTLVRCGGHFAGAQVLHVAAERALLSGDIVHVVPDRRYVTFMYSYPNMIPLPPSRVRAVAAALEPYAFDRIYGAWFGAVVLADGNTVVRRSADRYVRAVSEPGLPN